MEGAARIVEEPIRADAIPAYVDKYREQIHALGWTPETFADDYSVLMRLGFDKVRSG